MKKIINIYICFILTVLGCSKEDYIVTASEDSVLVPLSIGNSWTYRLNSDRINTESIDSTLKIDDQIGYWLNIDKGSWKAQKVVYNTQEGFFLDNRLYIGANNHAQVFIYPCTQGMKWTNTQYFMGKNITNHYEVLSTSERIELSCGIFYCYVYKEYSNDTSYTLDENQYQCFRKYYFVPGIGRVLLKTVITDENFEPLKEFDEITSSELIELDIEKFEL